MRQFLNEQARIADEIEQKKVRGLLEGHAEVKTLRQAQKSNSDRLDTYAADYNKTQALLRGIPRR